jgi:hypothetical protein
VSSRNSSCRLLLNAYRSPLLIVVRRLLQRSFSLLKKTIIGLNLFENQSRDVRIQRYQVVATRVYVTILIVCLLTIALYQGIREDIRQERVQNPTLSRYLELETLEVDSLACPCTKMSVARQKFISLEPIYHQVCSSFVVSSSWVNYLDIILRYQYQTKFPYRVSLAPFFRLLDTLCKHAQETVNDTLRSFLQTDFLSAQILRQSTFTPQFEALIESWKFTTVNGFQLETTLFQAVQQGNKYLNDFYNFKYNINQSNGEINIVPVEYPNCSCELSQQCRTPAPIGRQNLVTVFEYEVAFTIDDFFVGCSLLDVLTQSTLQCFYNQTCLDEIRLQLTTTYAPSTTAPPPTFNAMAPTNRWPTESTETIQSIVNRLMVIEWRTNISFANYYLSCAPTHCVLEYRSRQDLFLTLVAVFSVLGGLSTGLKLLMLILVRTAETLSAFDGHVVIRRLFVDMFTCQRREQIVSRVRLAIFLVLVCVFYLISFVPSRVLIVSINKPSLSLYEDLLKTHRQSFQCSCSKISFNYETFLSIDFRSHAICSSPFVSEDWILYTYQQNGPFLRFDRTDFRRTAVGQYQLLSSFCALSRKNVQDALLQLSTTAFTDTRLVSSDELLQRMQIVFDTFKRDAPRTFLAIFNTVREMTETNSLGTMYSSDWRVRNVCPNQFYYLNKVPVVYGSCSCGTSTRCTQPSGSMRVGCYPLEALLQSNLRCFYDQSCINPSGTFPALNYSSHLTRFELNATVESILDQLMIEEYSLNISYQSYFAECAVSSCSYSHGGRQEPVEIVTSIIGLYGGLLVISRWLTAILTRLWPRRVTHIHPEIQ